MVHFGKYALKLTIANKDQICLCCHLSSCCLLRISNCLAHNSQVNQLSLSTEILAPNCHRIEHHHKFNGSIVKLLFYVLQTVTFLSLCRQLTTLLHSFCTL